PDHRLPQGKPGRSLPRVQEPVRRAREEELIAPRARGIPGQEGTTMTQATHVYRRIGSVAFALFVLGAAPGVAAPPDVKTIIANMKQAMESAPASLRKVRLTVAQEGTTSSITLGEARAKGADGNRILAVVLAPADLRGTAYLTLEQPASNADKL